MSTVLFEDSIHPVHFDHFDGCFALANSRSGRLFVQIENSGLSIVHFEVFCCLLVQIENLDKKLDQIENLGLLYVPIGILDSCYVLVDSNYCPLDELGLPNVLVDYLAQFQHSNSEFPAPIEVAKVLMWM